ncbi:hypothetical protein AB0F77_13750 [Streptomyces sp. NPDC026672]|uniref:hypothetical protein n=1 Tax=unclassified Streptomyces TaxID=2593676 RepID=UPI0033D84783
MTSNTLNEWAAGISDTLALGLVTEGIGKGLPIVALPHWNEAQNRHPAARRSVAELREAGVTAPCGRCRRPSRTTGAGTISTAERL